MIMKNINDDAVNLCATWFILPGCEQAADEALKKLAEDVLKNEPDTLMYFVHTAFLHDARLQSLPPLAPQTVVFFETYRNADAFLEHLNGPVFTTFVKNYGELFVFTNGKPFTTVSFLRTRAGFVRSAP